MKNNQIRQTKILVCFFIDNKKDINLLIPQNLI